MFNSNQGYSLADVAAATYNVGTEVLIDVPTCCCQTISVKNISSISVDVLDANLIVERVA